ncbi:LOW QUALITY PROTEIN: receptor-like protein EIX1 [Lycium ferocissimum]|uniref:LOW QUALITY PROTEIN: receptor-like protein EIX1 n=1 Tax=Lycium ferocissimum TaxID=112874 RepID=UPI00281509D9|nr:LOW QUALITY PROTEIN: receptor-like protein EIX1 [Lycium ferocissimum]
MDTKPQYKPIYLLLICLSILILHQSFAFGSISRGDHAKVLCIAKEREALLEIKRGLTDEQNILSSWGNEEDNEECCSWWGVKCSNTSGHIRALNLCGNRDTYLTGKISTSLVKLQYLKYLDLSSNNFSGQIPNFIGYLKRLEYLNLSSSVSRFTSLIPPKYLNHSSMLGRVIGEIPLSRFSRFTGLIPPQLQNLTHLRALDLGGNLLTVKSLEWLPHLVYLEYLDLSKSNVQAKNWLKEISKLPNLRELHLSSCELPIFIPSSVVLANISSSRLSILDISDNEYSSPATYSWLFNFTSLTSLDLSYNDLGQLASGFGYMKSLEHLKFSGRHFLGLHIGVGIEGRIPESFGNLRHLCSLDATYNHLSQPFSELLSILSGSNRSLEFLSFEGNALTGSLNNLTRFSTLRELRLHDNLLNGTFHESFRQISSLEYLDLSNNQMTGSLPDLALFLSLRELHLKSNHFNGTIPQGLGQLFHLESFDAPYNLLKGTISESHLSNLCNLKSLDLSSNPLTWNVSLDWVPCFQLQVIRLSSSNLGPLFPKWRQTQNSYSFLDLSLNSISDTMPSWFPKSPSTLYSLNLSYNQISGKIHDLLANNALMVIDFSYNNFSGPLPRFPKSLHDLYLNKNQFSGSLNAICILRLLHILDLSENLLSGEIPDCWNPMGDLLVLNVANNNISGSIPSSLCSSSSLTSLYVRNNNLSGNFPASLKNCQHLQVLDLGRNSLTGKIPESIWTKLAHLGILSLRFNGFSGSIPPSICQLQSIQILDLSGNHLSGRIPQCFSNFTELQQPSKILGTDDSLITRFIPRSSPDYHNNALVQWKNKESEYRNTLWLLKTIDLSSNELVDDIPRDFSKMIALASLNLSKNNLSGSIIEGIGLMKMLECLDLSGNQLSGKIPVGLANLTFLSVLNLSNNNFSGRIPSSTQLQGFDVSTYGGNVQLCGPPLPECPTFSPPNPHVGYDSTFQENDDVFLSKEFYISMALGFIVAFWGVSGSLLFKDSWRNACEKLKLIFWKNKNIIDI